MKPQWNNTYFLGTSTEQFYRVYSKRFYGDGVWITSDERLKTDVRPVLSSLTKIKRLNAFYYDYKYTSSENLPVSLNNNIAETSKNQVGFMAQDVMQIFPHLVDYDKQNDKYSVNYQGMIPELVRAIQEQQEIIEELREEINTLKAQSSQNGQK